MELYRHTHWCKVVFFISLLHCVWGDCIDWDLGMENDLIPDERIAASSAYSTTPATFGRLNDGRGSWCVLYVDKIYLQIDLQSLHVICAVSTQGEGIFRPWVTKYTLQSSIDNKRWTDYKENGLVKIFDGNNDQNTAKKNVLSNVLITRWLRFVVKDFKDYACMRTEVYGVKQKPENIVAGKSTTQSSIYSDDYSNGTSDKAVDGNPDQEFKNGHCSRTLEDDPSWWRVDLSSPVQVFEVRIVTGNSPSSDGSNVTRNQVYNITLGDSFIVTNNPVCARWDGSFDLETSLVCHIDPPRSGRYVGILTTRRQFLQLCEVEIFSKEDGSELSSDRSSAIFEESEASFVPHDEDLEPLATQEEAAAYKNGLGAVYLQYGDPVAYALHALTEDESRYLQVEKEMLAATFTCQKFHDFIYGREAIIETDHKPITAILNKSLHTALARLQRMLLQLQRYNLKFIYRRETELHVADALSRACNSEEPGVEDDDQLEVLSFS
ncbi:uncharacterized protein [Montipora capricornis]|uniref:uncharacterized protein n=1 Tax=Montipora capricornis TaxID=246305 RepID=UPI0035F1D47C